jgi:hypothetical protein
MKSHSYVDGTLNFLRSKDRSGSIFSEGDRLNKTFEMVTKRDHMNSDAIKKNDAEKHKLKDAKKKKNHTFENKVFKSFEHKIEEREKSIIFKETKLKVS